MHMYRSMTSMSILTFQTVTWSSAQKRSLSCNVTCTGQVGLPQPGLRVGVDQQRVRYAIPKPDALLVELLLELLDFVHAEHDLKATERENQTEIE